MTGLSTNFRGRVFGYLTIVTSEEFLLPTSSSLGYRVLISEIYEIKYLQQMLIEQSKTNKQKESLCLLIYYTLKSKRFLRTLLTMY